MRILLPENTTYNMEFIPDNVEEDLQYCVLDYSTPSDADFIFVPLVFLDVFSRPAADLKIGKYNLQLPLDWSIVIADKDLGLVEIIELKHLNDRDFDAFVLNPLKSYMPDFCDLSIVNIYNDITWHVPKLKYGHILVVPLNDSPKPPCIFCAKEVNRIPESLDITKIFT